MKSILTFNGLALVIAIWVGLALNASWPAVPHEMTLEAREGE